MAETKTVKKDVVLVEVVVAADNHTHAGKPCAKGDKIKVSPDAKVMLEKAWAKAEKAGE